MDFSNVIDKANDEPVSALEIFAAKNAFHAIFAR